MSDEPWVQLAEEASSDKLETYLSIIGFKFEEFLGSRGAVYRSREGKVVILPTTESVDDYQRRVFSVIESLSRILDQDRYRIAKAISSIGYHVLKIRTGIGSSSYSLDLDDAIDTLHSGYALVDYSAVKATSNVPVSYIQGRRTKKVSNYLDTVRMGQTEPGSFVLTLLLPTLKSADLVGQNSETVSLGERVSDTLVAGLSASKSMVAHGRKVTTEISANFASALAEIVKVSPEVEIGVDRRSTNQHFDVVQFSRDDEDPLREIADRLAPRVETRRRSISGTIVNLGETRGQQSGHFVVEVKIGDDLKNVRVPYSKPERKKIIQGYDKKADLIVKLQGNLIRSAGGRYTLEDPVDMELVPRGSLA